MCDLADAIKAAEDREYQWMLETTSPSGKGYYHAYVKRRGVARAHVGGDDECPAKALWDAINRMDRHPLQPGPGMTF